MGELQPGETLRLQIAGIDEIGIPREFVALLSVPNGKTGKERMQVAGLEVIERDSRVIIDNVAFDSPAEKVGLDWDQEILSVRVPTGQPPKELMWIPALILLGVVVVFQRTRQPKARAAEQAA
jgi:hypothetical protein